MASKPFNSMFRGVGRNALDLPVAGLAAAAAVFFAFAMPQELLSQIVSATGLPSLFAAAQPPLGLTARIAIALGGALVTFGLVFFLLRVLDRSGLDSGKAKPPSEADEGEAPRRRRDHHPDAPICRPISAVRELGEPAPPPLPKAPVPAWLDEPQPEAVAEAPEPAREPESPLAPAAQMPTSLSALMERLEQGLARRQPRPDARAFAPTVAPQVFPEAPDDRLQSAIDSLQRLAARQP